MNRFISHAQRFCIYAVLAAALVLLAVFAVSGLGLTARLEAHEHIEFVRDALLPNLLCTAALIALAAGALRLLGGRLGRLALAVAAAMLGGAAIWFLLGADTQQMYDFAYVAEAAQLFARGNYKPMEIDYFNVCSYQLGVCLPMEMLLRVLPGFDVTLFMQAFGVVISLASALLLALLAREMFPGAKPGTAVFLLCLLFLPLYLYPAFVYSTLPMLLMVLLSMLCFVRYIRGRKARDGVGFALAIAVAYMLKPNAAIMLLALILCALLDAVRSRDIRLAGFAALAAVLALALARGVIWQYEMRSGVALTENVSMLARFVMGLQEGGGSAGWYNSYIEQFFSFDVTPEQEAAVATADLSARLGEMAANPGMTLAFYRDKLLSQWLEPTCGTMWYGHLCEQAGPLAQLARTVYAQGGAVRAALEGYMNIFQQALYVLACLGLLRTLREKPGVVHMLLPLCVLGGCLYHMLFEAKSQYAFVYLMFMMPLAAQGLGMLAREKA